MKIAQRGTSSTTSGFGTVDRFAVYYAGADEAPTQSQADVASGTTPYTLGFRKALKITNGNQTGGAGTGDQFYISHKIESQDMATSGWNYTSTSSKITLSFWVKSSVSQNFYGYLKTGDGTAQNYPFETGSLSADTWTKITKTIVGNSNLQFDIDTNLGIEIVIAQWFGTDKTGSVSLNAWGAWSSSNRLPDFGAAMDDWYTTNDATFEITGVQLEVSDHASDFQFRSFAEELALCQRYFHKSGDIGQPQEWFPGVATYCQYGAVPAKCLDGDQDRAFHEGHFPTLMRDQPTLVFYPARDGVANTAGNVSKYNSDTLVGLNTQPSAGCQRMIGYFATDTTHPAFTFQYTADAEL
tara:strand:- start:207 stop:1268 length:1062 start_codon:yes stop_codon:yes gene_type:complete